MRLELRTLLALALASAAACTNEASTEQGDPPVDAGAPTPLGSGLRLAEVNALDSGVRPAPNQMNVNVTGVSFIIRDEYAETGLASSVGSIYVQDFHRSVEDAGATPPYSGMDIYKPTFDPPSLALAPGDVIDLVGEYQQYDGPTTDPFGGQYQPEMYEPIITFRFDYTPPQPTLIDVKDLNLWSTGYRWMSMLVVIAPEGGFSGGTNFEDGAGRCKVFLSPTLGQDAIAMDNELFDLPCQSMFPDDAGAGGTHFKSVTGVVTYFGSFTISPRSMQDIVLE